MKRQAFIYVLAMSLSICAVSMGEATLVDPGIKGAGLSPDGTIIAGSNFEGQGYWTEAGGFVSTGGSWAREVTDDLTVIGTEKFPYLGASDLDMAAYWTVADEWTPIYGFTGAIPCGLSLSSVSDISSDARYVAGHSWRDDWECHTHGMVYDIQAGTIMRLVGIDDDSTSVRAVSNEAKLMAGWEQTDSWIPVIWDEFGNPTRIEGASFGEGTVVSADGVWAGGYMDNTAWIWSAATGTVALGKLPGPYVTAMPLGMSADGSIIVGAHLTEGVAGLAEGWIYTAETGMIRIGAWAVSQGLTEAANWGANYIPKAISDDGSAIMLDIGMGDTRLLTIEQPKVCEMQYDCNGLIDISDVVWFYEDWKLYDLVHSANLTQYFVYVDGGYYHQYTYCGVPTDMDYNGNGVVDLVDVLDMYNQYLNYANNPATYYDNYPDSGC